MNDKDIMKKTIERFENAGSIKIEEKEDGSIQFTAIPKEKEKNKDNWEPIKDKDGKIVAYRPVSTEV